MQDRTVFEDTVGQLREKLAKAEVRRCLAETFFFYSHRIPRTN